MTLSSEFLKYVFGDVSSLTKIINQMIVIIYVSIGNRDSNIISVRKGHGSNRHDDCCRYYYDHYGIGGHHNEAKDWKDIFVWNFRPDYRTACWIFVHADDYIFFLMAWGLLLTHAL
jgi:hypothetical protein